MTKIFGPFFVVLSSVTSLDKQIIGARKHFWQLMWKLWEHFLGPEMLLKTQFSEKEGKFPVKKSFWPIFLVIANMKNVMEHFYMGPEGNLRSIVQATDWPIL